jgi:hypothetical protein
VASPIVPTGVRSKRAARAVPGLFELPRQGAPARSGGPRAGRPAGPAGGGLGNTALSCPTAGQPGPVAGVAHAGHLLTSGAGDLPPAGDELTFGDVRWAVHTSVAWGLSRLKKVRSCRRYTADPDSDVVKLVGSRSIDHEGVDLGFGGLKTCGSWHSCVLCSCKIAVHRAGELDHIFRVHRKMGGGVLMGTFSCRHQLNQFLEDLVAAQRGAWDYVRSDRPWKADLAALGVSRFDAHAQERAELELMLLDAGPDEATELRRRLRKLRKTWGVIRAFEVTRGDEHGWHPHFHVFFLVDEPVSEELARAALAPMWERWEDGLAQHGLTAVARVRDRNTGEMVSAGFDVKVMDQHDAGVMGRYPFKLALEAVGAVFKNGGRNDREGRPVGQRHRTPFEVMEHLAVSVAAGDAEAIDADRKIVDEWSITANKMRFRQCPLPPGMRAYFAAKAAELGVPGPLLEEEQTDEEIAAAEVPEAETWAYVGEAVYNQVVAYEMDTLRAAGRQGGFRAVVAWFDQRSIPLELTAAGEALLLDETSPPTPDLVGLEKGS